jgi:hypothetical protein
MSIFQVRRVIKQKWYRFRIRHGRHPSGRRRSSRTSSFFLPTGTEVHPLRALKNKMCPDLGRDTFVEDMSTIGPKHVQTHLNHFAFDNHEHEENHHLSCTCIQSEDEVSNNKCFYCCCSDIDDEE